MPEFFLLTKDNCALCVHAIQLIHQQELPEPIQLNMVDITHDPALVVEYGLLVPVLVRGSDDAELKWPFAADQLQEFLSQ
ncbi:glutaredoxin family protein [Aliidiomarina halalkaliphila]|uniref:Glutaredoxin family protein n=1 Tax=Aliidiomarina halalkaliphila TaxID=2593535 RepID=A0A552X418_9GAMM|nr:glutaredoxin family protein [Aliidiomarina halalkaliphila]TRW49735.1 glutaredoxin family protein [Aliidiomarina halalkaliphila]